jgi:hypothetical protein
VNIEHRAVAGWIGAGLGVVKAVENLRECVSWNEIGQWEISGLKEVD